MNDVDPVKRYFDSTAQQWYDLYHTPKTANDKVLQNRKNAAIAFTCEYLKPGAKILDAGCGAGVVAMGLVDKGFTVHGIDVSQNMVDICERTFSQSGIHLSKYVFTVGDVAGADYAQGSFDGILALGFLEYQKNEHKVLTHFHEILQPGGIVVVSGPIKTRFSNYFGLRDNRGTISINRYNPSRFEELFESTGFTLVEYKRYGYANFRHIRPFGRLFRLIGVDAFLHHTLTRISRFLPIDRFANDIIAVATKKAGG